MCGEEGRGGGDAWKRQRATWCAAACASSAANRPGAIINAAGSCACTRATTAPRDSDPAATHLSYNNYLLVRRHAACTPRPGRSVCVCSPAPDQAARVCSSAASAHIMSAERRCTRGVSCCSGVSSLRNTCSASKARPASRCSRYFCSNNVNFISCHTHHMIFKFPLYLLLLGSFTICRDI